MNIYGIPRLIKWKLIYDNYEPYSCFRLCGCNEIFLNGREQRQRELNYRKHALYFSDNNRIMQNKYF